MTKCEKFLDNDSSGINYMIEKNNKMGKVIMDSTKFLMECVKCNYLHTDKCKPEKRQAIIEYLDENLDFNNNLYETGKD